MPTLTTATLYAAIICKLVTAVFHSVLLVIVVFTIHKNTIEKKTKGLIYRFIVYLVSIAISQWTDGFRNLLYGNSQSFEQVVPSTLYAIRLVFDFIGFTLWYSMVFYQVRSVFQGTYFELTKCAFTIQKGILMLFIISVLSVLGGIIFGQTSVSISMSIAFLSYGSGYSHLIFLFNRNLFQMLKQQSKSTDGSAQLPILRIMRRSAVLISIHAVICVFEIVVNLCIAFGIVPLIIHFIAVSIWYCYTAVCMFLMLRINEKYYQCLCGVCDAGFKRICNCIAGRCIDSNEKHLAELQSSVQQI